MINVRNVLPCALLAGILTLQDRMGPISMAYFLGDDVAKAVDGCRADIVEPPASDKNKFKKVAIEAPKKSLPSDLAPPPPSITTSVLGLTSAFTLPNPVPNSADLSYGWDSDIDVDESKHEISTRTDRMDLNVNPSIGAKQDEKRGASEEPDVEIDHNPQRTTSIISPAQPNTPAHGNS
ncbi:hypothetical protein GYMLUDRAFT_235902 [Collybiopsis luxurians FD-317 M1]|nr:hypothetical protein GYMLUDRAFT_235902 [Collybiopsis luxurians FD-317 M1]